MHEILISEMDERAHDIAHRYGLGIETIAFCQAENMDDAALVEEKRRRLAQYRQKSLHAPFCEITPCAIDPLIGRASLGRYRQAVAASRRLGVHRMVVHSGFLPMVYYPEWFLPKSVSFWRDFADELSDDFSIVLENVFDPVPDYLAEIVDGVNSPRLGVCLDVGHVNAYSKVPLDEWIHTLGKSIRHVHLHNNYGTTDTHNALSDGSIPMNDALDLLNACAPDAAWCIESRDAERCLRELMEYRCQ